MIRVLTIEDVRDLVRKIGLKSFMLRLIEQLERDFSRWNEFDKKPRLASHYPYGVIELMPITDKEYYSFKYVNGHPGNTKHNKLTVVAIGLLAKSAIGYPILISEMTLLTALRTAATSALASKYLARKDVKRFGIIGTGAQSEFQALAHVFALGIDEIYYFDTDPRAMEKFAANLRPFNIDMHPCENAQAVVSHSDIITTATAKKGHAKILLSEWVEKGTHINKIGGDCPGKTELDPSLTAHCKIVVELLEQTRIEGEIQLLSEKNVYAELWEIAAKKKPGRTSGEEITLFDSVGFALEDYSILRFVETLAEEQRVGHMLNMIPDALDNPKNLFSLL